MLQIERSKKESEPPGWPLGRSVGALNMFKYGTHTETLTWGTSCSFCAFSSTVPLVLKDPETLRLSWRSLDRLTSRDSGTKKVNPCCVLDTGDSVTHIEHQCSLFHVKIKYKLNFLVKGHSSVTDAHARVTCRHSSPRKWWQSYFTAWPQPWSLAIWYSLYLCHAREALKPRRQFVSVVSQESLLWMWCSPHPLMVD